MHFRMIYQVSISCMNNVSFFTGLVSAVVSQLYRNVLDETAGDLTVRPTKAKFHIEHFYEMRTKVYK